MSAILEATNINKIYDEGAVSTQVLTGLDLTVHDRGGLLLEQFLLQFLFILFHQNHLSDVIALEEVDPVQTLLTLHNARHVH